jgi:SPP1 gp7 family putative phage head morphogenesis protein
MARNPLRADPTRTTLLRRRFLADMSRRFDSLKRAIVDLIDKQDALGLKATDFVFNARWKFRTSDEKVAAFREWLKQETVREVLSVDTNTGQPWLSTYVHSSYRQGVQRAWEDANRGQFFEKKDFLEGSKAQFLRDAFNQPEAVSKLKLLATRTFEDLRGVTEQMAAAMNRVLSDGVAHGRHPRVIARELAKQADVSKAQAKTIARTEVIHAHSEGQLDSFERMGIEEVGAEVEFVTANDSRVCERCRHLEGTVRTVDKARGVIPVHPNCRCAWIPYFGESVIASRKRLQRRSA